MRIDQVKTQIVEYLEENGSASVSELVRAIGCGKSTIYEALSSLESEGKVTSTMRRNRRIVTLTYGVPNYLKTLISLTAICLALLATFGSSPTEKIVVNLDGGETHVVYVVGPVIIPVIALSVLTGFWIAVAMFKQDDLYALFKHVRAAIAKPIDQLLEKP